ncbi:MAG TPA: SRPBCC family protein [Saprospiraceae bacterium]|nr:SRPBCC family protein [Saprospiraceae bacterium]HNT22180.1 SRPBCC family protein [Saprospiraceae bacterium]
MSSTEKTVLTIVAGIQAPVEKVWACWTEPRHIIKWNAASPDWQCPYAENDLRPGGKFMSRMEAKDGSYGFDFAGEYTRVDPLRLIEYTLGDGRKVQTTFVSSGGETRIISHFEAENSNSLEMQQQGWQAILNNFKKHAESAGTETMQFEVKIQAPVEKVYSNMLDDIQYRAWTSVFNPTSHYKGSWEKGSKILFIGTDQDGNTGGMVSRIRENIPNTFVSIEHLGVVQGEQEITSGPQVEAWAGALENYTFRRDGTGTRLVVDLEANEEYKSYFEEHWPKALDKLKSICEGYPASAN